MIEGERHRPTVGGERVGTESPAASRTPKPRLVLDWERRAKILEQEVESQAQQIVGLKEELADQDSRIKALEARLSGAGKLVEGGR